MARFGSRYLAGDFAVEKGFFYNLNEAVEKVSSRRHSAVNQTGYQVS
jgi:hypothetical protein